MRPAQKLKPEEPKKRSAKSVVSESAARPIKQPRNFVLKKYQESLEAGGLAFVAVDDVRRTTPAVAPHVAALDYIVLRGEEKLLVTVHPHLKPKHLKATTELQKLFGSEYKPVRIWPADGPEGWIWQEHAIGDAATHES